MASLYSTVVVRTVFNSLPRTSSISHSPQSFIPLFGKRCSCCWFPSFLLSFPLSLIVRFFFSPRLSETRAGHTSGCALFSVEFTERAKVHESTLFDRAGRGRESEWVREYNNTRKWKEKRGDEGLLSGKFSRVHVPSSMNREVPSSFSLVARRFPLCQASWTVCETGGADGDGRRKKSEREGKVSERKNLCSNQKRTDDWHTHILQTGRTDFYRCSMLATFPGATVSPLLTFNLCPFLDRWWREDNSLNKRRETETDFLPCLYCPDVRHFLFLESIPKQISLVRHICQWFFSFLISFSFLFLRPINSHFPTFEKCTQ